jgi:xanthine dehydrogenase accessory factor
VYGIALSVAACLRAGTNVDVVWIVASDDFPDRDATDAIAITPGGGRVGSLLSGALDGQAAHLPRSRLVDVTITEVDALVVGLPRGGTVRCLVVPATDLPIELWDALLERRPVGLITHLDGADVTGTELFEVGPTDEARSHTVVATDRVVTILFPVTKLVIVGSGPIADALQQAAAPLGWQTQVTNDAATATGLIAALAPLDKVVVAAHDLELAGAALASALDSDAGYIGALGGRNMQQTRADWLAYRGITETERIHGPAGFDIGADTPPKVAISILAEALAVEAGKPGPRTLDPDDAAR